LLFSFILAEKYTNEIRIIEEKIPLTVCPLSNLKLCVFKKLSDHNLKKLLQKNVKVTINSDDPAYFGGYVNQNYLETAKALDLSHEDIKTIAANSFEASFLSPAAKAAWLEKIHSIGK
jgi:adenosine deaminase